MHPLGINAPVSFSAFRNQGLNNVYYTTVEQGQWGASHICKKVASGASGGVSFSAQAPGFRQPAP
ncbi:hypothetical protein BJP37_13145 [Moorena bouillonii PNG]|uniref:Uncharacterized protein n=1 Tax=Moorena bouillonii PNG TaxID=568701 RepID=A0A1U7N1J3_9CYAN|nr:hypothetical protein BJP37_13145 [Moorena bouillonii PNG]